MTFPLGATINALAVVIGCVIGMLLGNKLTDELRKMVFQVLGLCILVIGLGMALKTSNPLIMIGSLLIGGFAGTLMHLENHINNGANRLKKLLKSKNELFRDGFITTMLMTCIGSMAVLGSLEEGLEGSISIVTTKSLLDFFAAMALGAAYGAGVAASAIVLFVYQGAITIFAVYIRDLITPLMKSEMEAVGGILIIGIALNLLEMQKIKLSNLLPSLIVVIFLCLAL